MIASLAIALAALSTLVDARATKLFSANVGHLVDARLDPLVSPGTCTGHVHSVFGNAEFGATAKKTMFVDEDWAIEDGRHGQTSSKYGQTTSELIPNLSSYWAPSLYIFEPASQLYHLVPTFVRPYYRITHYKALDRSVVNPIPPFLRLIVGDASRKTAWEAGNTDRDDIRWTLTTLNRQATNYQDNGDWSYLFDNADIDDRGQVEALLKFPDCLAVKGNGKPKLRASRTDFRSHAAYADVAHWDEVRRSVCPDSHPYQIPRLDLEVRFLLDPMRDLLGAEVVNDVNNWRLSTGDASGAGVHADFISGWPEDLMTDIIANCEDSKSKDGEAHCILEDYDLDRRIEKTVPYENLVPNEEVHTVSSLPMGECPPAWTTY